MDSTYRVGQGIDRHRLAEGRSLVLGGVNLDAPKGTVGHSDGDVLVHSIIDALLGAAGLGDIGEHFPDDDPAFEDVSSLDLLDDTLRQLSESNWTPVNVDTTVQLDLVKLKPYRSEMYETIRKHFPQATDLNLKFTTAEGLGPVGRDEAIDARTIALLSRNE